jgi:hypothetical protein
VVLDNTCYPLTLLLGVARPFLLGVAGPVLFGVACPLLLGVARPLLLVFFYIIIIFDDD